MILGIGIDLLNIERVEILFSKFGDDRLFNKILTEEEINEYKKSQKNPVNFLAKKFSAKEAFSKALGTGIGRGINFSDITIKNDILGKPIIVLNDKGCNFLENYYKLDFKNLQIDLSITDEKPFVNCFVIISSNNS